ncbi:MAG: hypothetical protein DCC57_16795 [Chloroflexi bacterium]|nr:MAG: hypothetical protein DCC57_16795 [Chloroflexota bacterium]
MLPEEILTTCIAALEAGEEPAAVLARYPEYVAELELILYAVATLRGAQKPRLSGPAFVRGRRALAEALAARQAAAEAGAAAAPPPDETPPEAIRPGPLTPDEAAGDAAPDGLETIPSTSGAPALPAGAVIPSLSGGRPSPRRFAWPGLGLAAAAVALLAVVVLAGSSGSLPGSPLYTLKRAAESLQGAIMTSAGSEAAWQARQVERRLAEALALEAAGQPVDARLLAEVERMTQAALAAVNELPARVSAPVSW